MTAAKWTSCALAIVSASAAVCALAVAGVLGARGRLDVAIPLGLTGLGLLGWLPWSLPGIGARTRKSGGQRFIEFHLEIPRATSFEDSHALVVRVLRAVEREVPQSKVFVHGDPV